MRQRPRVTRGAGGQKGLDKLVKRLFSSKLGLKSVGKFLRPIIKRIPFVGFLIDFALNVFLFKESLGKSAFKAIGAGLGTWIGTGMGTFLGAGFASWITGPIGAYLGAQGGDAFGGWMYDQIFGNQASTKTTAPSDMSADEIVGGTPPANDPNYQRALMKLLTIEHRLHLDRLYSGYMVTQAEKDIEQIMVVIMHTTTLVLKLVLLLLKDLEHLRRQDINLMSLRVSLR